MSRWGIVRRFRLVPLLLLTLCVLLPGCVKPVAYVPDPTVVEQIGLPVAKQRLRTLLLRAVAPPINRVELGDEFLHYSWHPALGTQIFLGNIGRVEVFENRTVIIYGAAGQVLGSIVCATLEDSEMLADIMISLRGYHYRHRLALSRTPQSGDRPTVRIARAQEALGRLGFYHGAVDGVLDETTEEAIRLYQTSQRLPATGALDRATRARLGIR